LLNRRVGTAGAREIAACPDLAEALARLAATPYGRAIRPDQTLEGAQFALRATLLWHIRVLVGWQPREGARLVRLLAGWFEVANVCEHARVLAGHPAGDTYRMGTLAVVWPRLAATRSPAELRAELTASPWGDPGGDAPHAVALGMELSWAARLCAATTEEISAWAAGAVALLVARERFLAGRRITEPLLPRLAALLGAAAADASSVPDLRHRLTAHAAWSLSECDSPDRLWAAEIRWWARVERDGFELLRRTGFAAAPVVGVVGLLAADCWRACAALELAARGGGSLEVLDAVA
jgi:hypothetical protein